MLLCAFSFSTAAHVHFGGRYVCLPKKFVSIVALSLFSMSVKTL